MAPFLPGPKPPRALGRATIAALAVVIPLAAAPVGWGQAEETSGLSACLDELARSYTRPFGPKAPWNVPVAGLPVDPDSDRYVERLWRHGSEKPGNFNLTFDEYTYPVYDARLADGWRPVRTRRRTNLDGNQVPWHPDWSAASGSDGQVIILDPETGREWDLWQVYVEDGVVRASNGNLVPGSYWTREVGFPPSRGIGIPYLAMLVRPAEVARREIPHALSMAIMGIDRSEFVPPATNTDGSVAKWAVRNGIPEGTRFALRVTDAEIESWVASLPLSRVGKQSARTIARALRDYGWFITDNAGAAHLQFEDRLTAGPAWSLLGLDRTEVGDKEYPRDLLDGLMRRDRIYAIAPSDQYPAELRASADHTTNGMGPTSLFGTRRASLSEPPCW